MANIRHIALTTPDLEQVASFYKDVFGMAGVGRASNTHIYLSDGDLNVTIRACKKRDDPDVGAQGEDFSGMHHIGFINIHTYIRQIYDVFGPQRCFWGTDITRMPCPYRQCVTMFTEELL